jgi:hypothetical protein
MIRSIVLSLLAAVGLAGTIAAQQPDRTAILEKAKADFEKDVAKAEKTLLAGIDKTMLQATKTGNKALQEKLTYERDQFVTNHFVPTAFPAEDYLRQRSKATNSLLKLYQKEIIELTKVKKMAEATALEDSLNEMLKLSRGYGLAFPDLETQPIFLIENKKTGLVLDTLNKEGTGDLLLTKKPVGRPIKSQCWRLEREERGFVIRNVASGQGCDVYAGNRNAGTVVSTWPVDRKKATIINSLFRLTEIRHEIVIECAVNSLILTATEKKEKGVTTTCATQERKEEMPLATQLWTLTEVK